MQPKRKLSAPEHSLGASHCYRSLGGAHELVELLHVTAPQASRLIRNWREAALTAGLKESAFVRFEREGRGKRWYATNLLTAALTISPQKPIPEPAEERA
jgi:hypothetical protein